MVAPGRPLQLLATSRQLRLGEDGSPPLLLLLLVSEPTEAALSCWLRINNAFSDRLNNGRPKLNISARPVGAVSVPAAAQEAGRQHQHEVDDNNNNNNGYINHKTHGRHRDGGSDNSNDSNKHNGDDGDDNGGRLAGPTIGRAAGLASSKTTHRQASRQVEVVAAIIVIVGVLPAPLGPTASKPLEASPALPLILSEVIHLLPASCSEPSQQWHLCRLACQHLALAIQGPPEEAANDNLRGPKGATKLGEASKCKQLCRCIKCLAADPLACRMDSRRLQLRKCWSCASQAAVLGGGMAPPRRPPADTGPHSSTVSRKRAASLPVSSSNQTTRDTSGQLARQSNVDDLAEGLGAIEATGAGKPAAGQSAFGSSTGEPSLWFKYNFELNLLLLMQANCSSPTVMPERCYSSWSGQTNVHLVAACGAINSGEPARALREAETGLPVSASHRTRRKQIKQQAAASRLLATFNAPELAVRASFARLGGFASFERIVAQPNGLVAGTGKPSKVPKSNYWPAGRLTGAAPRASPSSSKPARRKMANQAAPSSARSAKSPPAGEAYDNKIDTDGWLGGRLCLSKCRAATGKYRNRLDQSRHDEACERLRLAICCCCCRPETGQVEEEDAGRVIAKLLFKSDPQMEPEQEPSKVENAKEIEAQAAINIFGRLAAASLSAADHDEHPASRSQLARARSRARPLAGSKRPKSPGGGRPMVGASNSHNDIGRTPLSSAGRPGATKVGRRDNGVRIINENNNNNAASSPADSDHRYRSRRASQLEGGLPLADSGLGAPTSLKQGDKRPRQRTTTTTTTTSDHLGAKRSCALYDHRPYVIYSALGSFYIPMFIMLFFYSRIYLVASRSQRALRRGYMITKWPASRSSKTLSSTTSCGGSRGSVMAKAKCGAMNGHVCHAQGYDHSGGCAASGPFGGDRVTLRIHRRSHRTSSGPGATTGATAIAIDSPRQLQLSRPNFEPSPQPAVQVRPGNTHRLSFVLGLTTTPTSSPETPVTTGAATDGGQQEAADHQLIALPAHQVEQPSADIGGDAESQATGAHLGAAVATDRPASPAAEPRHRSGKHQKKHHKRRHRHHCHCKEQLGREADATAACRRHRGGRELIKRPQAEKPSNGDDGQLAVQITFSSHFDHIQDQQQHDRVEAKACVHMPNQGDPLGLIDSQDEQTGRDGVARLPAGKLADSSSATGKRQLAAQSPKPAGHVTSRRDQSRGTLLAAEPKWRPSDSHGASSRSDRSQSCVPEVAGETSRNVIDWSIRFAASSEQTLASAAAGAASESVAGASATAGRLAPGRPSGGGGSGGLLSPESRLDQLASCQQSRIAGERVTISQSGGLSLLPSQVRKQSMMLLSTLTTRGSQTLRRLSMVAYHPVDSLLHRSKSNDSNESVALGRPDGSPRSTEATATTAGRHRRHRHKRTLDDYLMAVAGIDSSSDELEYLDGSTHCDDSFGASDDDDDDDDDDEDEDEDEDLAADHELYAQTGCNRRGSPAASRGRAKAQSSAPLSNSMPIVGCMAANQNNNNDNKDDDQTRAPALPPMLAESLVTANEPTAATSDAKAASVQVVVVVGMADPIGPQTGESAAASARPSGGCQSLSAIASTETTKPVNVVDSIVLVDDRAASWARPSKMSINNGESTTTTKVATTRATTATAMAVVEAAADTKTDDPSNTDTCSNNKPGTVLYGLIRANGSRQRGFKRATRWHAKRLYAETKAAKTVAIIIGGFICCWLPFFTAYLSRVTICERPDCIPRSVLSTFIWLGYLNSAINPVIYGLFSADFRHAFKKIICRCSLGRNDDSATVSALVDNIIKSIL